MRFHSRITQTLTLYITAKKMTDDTTRGIRMTTLTNLITEAHKVYAEMENARWGSFFSVGSFSLLRKVKAPLLQELAKKDPQEMPQSILDLNNSDPVLTSTKLKTITAILTLCSKIEENPKSVKSPKEELFKLNNLFLAQFVDISGRKEFSQMAELFLNERVGQKRGCTLFNSNKNSVNEISTPERRVTRYGKHK
ncbi:MAG: hypothetical protein P4M12_03190 [Gammaproteobacteria bacterium]|nr:hypothetical protein [Gammaproteobacteria bacterium]